MSVTTLGARASAWWSSCQWVIYLLLALALSIALNVWQWKRSITAPLRAEVAAQGKALDDSAALAGESRAREVKLGAAADKVIAQLDKASLDYHSAAKAAPLDQEHCAPGQPRMDATNRALGAPPE